MPNGKPMTEKPPASAHSVPAPPRPHRTAPPVRGPGPARLPMRTQALWCAAVGRPVLEALRPEHVLFSFHGLPERHVKASDHSGSHCLQSAGCCDAIGPANRDCYRAQCHATARGLAGRLGLAPGTWSICFQSRLGRTPWIKPYTDVGLDELARAGKVIIKWERRLGLPYVREAKRDEALNGILNHLECLVINAPVVHGGTSGGGDSTSSIG